MLKTVCVKGEVQIIWQTLLNTLAVHGYQIEMQNPYTQIRAKRGSKVSTLLMESTKSGFRQLNVTLFPQRDTVEVQFNFEFPSWAITWPGTKKDCSAMVDEFVRLAEQAVEPTGPIAAETGTISCPSCGAQVRQGAKFCASCGAALMLTCAKCGAALQPGAKFCASCGAPV